MVPSLKKRKANEAALCFALEKKFFLCKEFFSVEKIFFVHIGASLPASLPASFAYRLRFIGSSFALHRVYHARFICASFSHLACIHGAEREWSVSEARMKRE